MYKKIWWSSQACVSARSPGEMVLLFSQLHLPRTSFLTAGDLPSWGHVGMGPSPGTCSVQDSIVLVKAAQHLSLLGPSSTGVRGCLCLRALAAAPLPASSFWDKYDAQSTPLPREHQDRRVPREGGSCAEHWHCHSSTRGHCTSRRRGGVAQPFLCTLNHSPFFIMALLHLFAAHQLWALTPANPSWTQTETRWFQQSCWPEAPCWLLPGATFCAYDPPTSLDAGVAHRAAVKQRLRPRGSKQHINPLCDLARPGDSQ